jgi:hypothetical protein
MCRSVRGHASVCVAFPSRFFFLFDIVFVMICRVEETCRKME